MTRTLTNRLVALALGLAALMGAPAARAQYGGQPGGMAPGMGPQQPMDEPKEDGPAEAAPEEDERASDLAPLGGYASQQRRRTQIIELDGYLRLRTDFLHKLNLGQGYIPSSQADMKSRIPPFPLPLECGMKPGSCSDKNLGSGNLRLRLEPTINVTDQVRVQTQFDILDNTIMGSTPDSLIDPRRPQDRSGKAPVSSLYTTQDPPELSRGSLMSSVRAKRAWGEIDSDFGSVRFGRMPWHFGRGIAFNNGACPDCDGGTNVDRIMALTQVYGHQLAAAWDFGAQGHHIGMIDLGRRDPGGLPLDLSQNDDVTQLMASVTHIDSERQRDERLAQGDLVFNYGAQIIYRSQSNEIFDIKPATDSGGGEVKGDVPTRDDLANPATFRKMNALVFLPSLWMRLQWKAFTVEAETSGVVGKVDNPGGVLGADKDRQMRLEQIGWVLASDLRLYSNALVIGFETGGASGDQAEDPGSYLNYRWKFVTQPAGDRRITDFKFNPDYHVDEILFRRILGTVTNAIYLKPQMTYWLGLAETRQVGFSAAFIYSLAPVPVSTPGNSLSYGIEMNLGINYRNPADGLFAGIVWGVLWPTSALSRPGATPVGGATVGRMPTESASSAQVLRAFVGIRF